MDNILNEEKDNMLTPTDIANLIGVLKAFFYTKEETDFKFDEVKENFSKLQSSVGNIAKMFTDNNQEVKVYGHRVDRLENWATPAGDKINLKFEA